MHLRIDTILGLKESHFHQLLAICQRKAPYLLCKSYVRPACVTVNITEENLRGRKGSVKDGFNVYMDEILYG